MLVPAAVDRTLLQLTSPCVGAACPLLVRGAIIADDATPARATGVGIRIVCSCPSRRAAEWARLVPSEDVAAPRARAVAAKARQLGADTGAGTLWPRWVRLN